MLNNLISMSDWFGGYFVLIVIELKVFKIFLIDLEAEYMSHIYAHSEDPQAKLEIIEVKDMFPVLPG